MNFYIYKVSSQLGLNKLGIEIKNRPSTALVGIKSHDLEIILIGTI